MTEVEQLEHAINVLEAQRSVLGDSVVEPALGALREKLAAVKIAGGAALAQLEERKIVTILFADLVGFTAMSERLDPEDVREIVSDYFSRWLDIITAHHGEVEKFIGDAVMAVFGLRLTRENDAENALRAALEMRESLENLNKTVTRKHGLQLAMRVGINTGPVVISLLREREGQDFVVIGDPVNLASRLENAAPPNSILISHNSYQLVQGLFEVAPQASLEVKGKSDLIQTYLVERAKPRAFRPVTRGVEGIETHLVGRDQEFSTLQALCRKALAGQPHCVTLVGEPGVGKSRLLFELSRWLDQWPESILYFRGRTSPNSQATTHGLIRDLFSRHFEILDTDPAELALAKFRAGMSAALTPDEADQVGQFVGFNFSTSPAVKAAISNGTLGEAASLLFRYLRLLTLKPVIIFAEDLHWADDSSLDLLKRLVTELPAGRLLILAATRRALLERRPSWGTATENFTQIALQPLTAQDTLTLIADILQNVADLPDSLRDLISQRSEGNPFYIEELVKMLLDDGVILRSGNRWHVQLERLNQTRVPNTLSGVLQARLDSLARPEKDLLQRASVIGRLFWDAAVEALAAHDTISENGAMTFQALCRRELIYQRDFSNFADSNEYIFKHGLLRDVTYETVMLKTRRDYHRRAAQWLEVNSGERASEYAGLIAEHYGHAGDMLKALQYWRQAGLRAFQIGALTESGLVLERAIELARPMQDHDPVLFVERVWAQLELGGIYAQRGLMKPAIQHLELVISEARILNNEQMVLGALQQLGLAMWRAGFNDTAQTYLNEALALATRWGNISAQAFALRQLGNTMMVIGENVLAEDYLSQSMVLVRQEADYEAMAAVLNTLALVIHRQGRVAEAIACHDEAIRLAKSRGDRTGDALFMGCKGWLAVERGEYEQGEALIEQSFVEANETGIEYVRGPNHFYLGIAALARHDLNRAWQCVRAFTRHYLRTQIGYTVTMGAALYGAILIRENNVAEGASFLNWVLIHPAPEYAARILARTTLDQTVRDALAPADVLEAAFKQAKHLDIDAAFETLSQAT